jgi:hypothetical protein
VTTLVAAAEADTHASAATVLEVLRDYRNHHPNILPPAFSGFVVEEGGYGLGTVMRFDMKIGGRSQLLRSRATESTADTLREEVLGRQMDTLFTVTPVGTQSRTRIETRWQPAPGVAGILERFFAPRMIEQIYRDELGRLDAYAQRLENGDGSVQDR